MFFKQDTSTPEGNAMRYSREKHENQVKRINPGGLRDALSVWKSWIFLQGSDFFRWFFFARKLFFVWVKRITPGGSMRRAIRMKFVNFKWRANPPGGIISILEEKKYF